MVPFTDAGLAGATLVIGLPCRARRATDLVSRRPSPDQGQQALRPTGAALSPWRGR